MPRCPPSPRFQGQGRPPGQHPPCLASPGPPPTPEPSTQFRPRRLVHARERLTSHVVEDESSTWVAVGYAVATVSESWTERRCGGAMDLARSEEMEAPLALVVLAAVLGWMGLHYVFSSTPTPPVPNNPSNISVYTSDPKAAVELVVFPAYNSTLDTLPGFQWVDFNFRIQAENGSVWWALALGGDAAPPPGELPDSGRLPTPSGERHGVCCHEVPVGRTYFYNPSTTAIEAPAFVTRGQLASVGGRTRRRTRRRTMRPPSSTGTIPRAETSRSAWR